MSTGVIPNTFVALSDFHGYSWPLDKVKIEADDEEDPWDEIVDESSQENTTSDVIDEELQDDFIEENTI